MLFSLHNRILRTSLASLEKFGVYGIYGTAERKEKERIVTWSWPLGL
jgi:hypothetical protein